jgi:hypothetical protein
VFRVVRTVPPMEKAFISRNRTRTSPPLDPQLDPDHRLAGWPTLPAGVIRPVAAGWQVCGVQRPGTVCVRQVRCCLPTLAEILHALTRPDRPPPARATDRTAAGG